MVAKPATFFGEEPQVEVENRNHATVEISVADALAIDGSMDAAGVQVTVKGTTIVLSGTVATPGEVERASEVARAVPGVETVTNQIQVG
ncbi:MAG: BON domain-containing protein [Rhizobium sp.]